MQYSKGYLEGGQLRTTEPTVLTQPGLQITSLGGAQAMEFTPLCGDDLLVSPKLHNGDWAYWLVIERWAWADHMSERELEQAKMPPYHVGLAAVSPAAARKKNIERAFEGYSGDAVDRKNKLTQVYALHSYGVKAPLWSKDGNDEAALLIEATRTASVISGLFGFYMDRVVNAIGDSGWDWISGNIGAAIRRRK